jgi:hypothetical protein
MDKTTTKPDLATTCQLVYIEWVDAVADVEWEDNVKAEIHPCQSVGWVISETEDAVCIANTVSMEMSNARMHIPKAWIKNRKVIKIETKQRKVKRKEPSKMGTRLNTCQVRSGK